MKRILYLTLCIFSISISQTLGQNKIFVSNGSGNNSNNGLSWGSAKKTIAAGIAAAGSNGTVYVKCGNYSISSQLTLSNGVKVKGGYQTISSGIDTTKRHLPNANEYWANEDYCTIINGSKSHRLALVADSSLLEGCVMNYGYTNDKGAGVLIDGGTVRYCVIQECNAINDVTFAAEGGGAYLRNGAVLSNSVITLCRGDIGPAVAGGNASLINNTITRNWPTQCGSVQDYDGNIYQSVVIGNQCWMRSNLRTTHYSDGTPISRGSSNSETTPYYYQDDRYVSNLIGNLPLYGYFYNWAAFMRGDSSSNANPSGVQGICPTGWHLPSLAEWQELRDFVKSRAVYWCNSTSDNIAKSLCQSQGWYTSSESCAVGNSPGSNNVTRFSAAPAGNWNGYLADFNSADYFATSTEASATKVRNANIWYDEAQLNFGSSLKTYAKSVRCVRNLVSGNN